MSAFLSRYPTRLSILVQIRVASTASTSQESTLTFPFPKHTNPTPHEIFHLPHGASQRDIKSRYYELVRVYHPDCPAARALPPSTSHSRFQAISDAYATLTGKRPSRNTWSRDVAYEEELLRRRRSQWRANSSSDEFGYSGQGHGAYWTKEGNGKIDQSVLVFVVIFTVASTILPLSMLSPFATSFSDKRHEEARKNLAIARREARELAEIRRTALLEHSSPGGIKHGCTSSESGVSGGQGRIRTNRD